VFGALLRAACSVVTRRVRGLFEQFSEPDQRVVLSDASLVREMACRILERFPSCFINGCRFLDGRILRPPVARVSVVHLGRDFCRFDADPLGTGSWRRRELCFESGNPCRHF
jgi:hypothetical protein